MSFPSSSAATPRGSLALSVLVPHGAVYSTIARPRSGSMPITAPGGAAVVPAPASSSTATLVHASIAQLLPLRPLSSFRSVAQPPDLLAVQHPRRCLSLERRHCWRSAGDETTISSTRAGFNSQALRLERDRIVLHFKMTLCQYLVKYNTRINSSKRLIRLVSLWPFTKNDYSNVQGPT